MLFLSLWRQEVSINRGFLQLKWPKVIKMCCGIVPVHAHGGIRIMLNAAMVKCVYIGFGGRWPVLGREFWYFRTLKVVSQRASSGQ